jgi:hypothetical protein
MANEKRETKFKILKEEISRIGKEFENTLLKMGFFDQL